MKSREYSSYEEYISHQIEKTDDVHRRRRLSKLEEARQKIFEERFKLLKFRNAFEEDDFGLCLGARYGEEVRALKTQCRAVGIDLVEQLPDVVKGDFHNIPFPDEHFDFVYTNSLDHAYDLEKVFSEVERVLKKNAYLCVDVDFGADGKHEATIINNLNDLISKFSNKLKIIDCMMLIDTRAKNVREVVVQKVPENINDVKNNLIVKPHQYVDEVRRFFQNAMKIAAAAGLLLEIK